MRDIQRYNLNEEVTAFTEIPRELIRTSISPAFTSLKIKFTYQESGMIWHIVYRSYNFVNHLTISSNLSEPARYKLAKLIARGGSR